MLDLQFILQRLQAQKLRHRVNNLKTFLLILIFSSCSLFEKKDREDFKYNTLDLEVRSEDYLSHISSFGKIYEDQSEIKLVNLRSDSKTYLESVVQKILLNNELFFKKSAAFDIRIVDSREVFHFSLPNKKIYLSSELVKKYIKNEKQLLCVLVFEMIRSEKNIYKEVSVFPTQVLGTKRILSLLILETKHRIELHKWAYYLLKRSGVDTDLYLSWLQILNRNSQDFSLMLEEKNSISYEESMFKNFLIANVKQNIKQVSHERSPKQFYRLLYDVNKL